MGYTREKIIGKIENASRDMRLFYKQDFINYLGKTTDTDEYFTEIVCEWLINNISILDEIPTITREKGYCTKGHDGTIKNLNSNRTEEMIAMNMFRQGNISYVGKIIDYQTPLKNTRNDKAGKIDLLSYDGNTLRILELKEPQSKESMLRCVVEGYTYLKTVDTTKLLENFNLPTNTVVVANPLVHIDSMQHDEMSEDRPKLKELIKRLNCKPLYFYDKDNYVIAEE